MNTNFTNLSLSRPGMEPKSSVLMISVADVSTTRPLIGRSNGNMFDYYNPCDPIAVNTVCKTFESFTYGNCRALYD